MGITLLQDILHTYIRAVHFALSSSPDDDVSSALGSRPARDFICISRKEKNDDTKRALVLKFPSWDAF